MADYCQYGVGGIVWYDGGDHCCCMAKSLAGQIKHDAGGHRGSVPGVCVWHAADADILLLNSVGCLPYADTSASLHPPVYYAGAAVAAVLAFPGFTRARLLMCFMKIIYAPRRAKGRVKPVVLKHGLRNAMIPVVTKDGDYTVWLLLGGSIVAEKVFNWPGLWATVGGPPEMRDYPVIRRGAVVFWNLFLLT